MIKSKKYYLAKTKGTANTFIGGVSATVNTAALVASKLGISAGRISNFSIVGSDIKFTVTGGSYILPSNMFAGNTTITYYYDLDGLVNGLNGTNHFDGCSNLKTLKFKNLPYLYSAFARNTSLSGTDNDFTSVATLTGASPLGQLIADPNTVINLPSLHTLDNQSLTGHASLSNNVTFNVPLALMTSNAGKPNVGLTLSTLKSVIINYIGYTDDTTYNTALGGYQNVYSNKGLLAAFLGFGSGAILNFQNTGTDVRFKTLINYALAANKYLNNTTITYYYDLDGLVTALGAYNTFDGAINLIDVKFKNITIIPPTTFRNTKLIGTNSDFTSVTTFSGALQFSGCAYLESLTFPSLINCGNTVGNDSVFTNIKLGATITVPIALQTANAGAPDGDLVYAATSRGATIIYI